MKFLGLEWLGIARNSPFYFSTLENWTTGLHISELANVQVNTEVLARSGNTLIGVLQDLELHLILNRISLWCIMNAGSRQIKYNLGKCKIIFSGKYILKFYKLPMSLNLQNSLRKRLARVIMTNKRSFQFYHTIKQKSSIKIALYFLCQEKPRKHIG